MIGFNEGNMLNLMGSVGNIVKEKVKSVAKELLKKLLKKLIKFLFKLLVQMIVKVVSALVVFFGVPMAIALMVIILVGGAIVYVRWIDGDDTASIQKATAAYNNAIIKTSKLEEYRPSLIVVQT